MQARAEADLLRPPERTPEGGGSWLTAFCLVGSAPAGRVPAGSSGATEDVREERKGPKTDAPDKALQGFLRGAGLASLDQCGSARRAKKGEFYVALVETPGRAAEHHRRADARA